MKKLSKTLLCASVALILGSGSAFAKTRNGMKARNYCQPGFRPSVEYNQNRSVTPKASLIGKISFVEEKTGTLKITDTDGKETSVIISPFTKIRVDDANDEKTISDIKKGDWILYSLFNTETEKKIAARIYVK